MTKSLERVVVHPGGHHLMTASGKPFFWLGDTAWELFHRLDRNEIEAYLDNRSRKGFNVIQAVILAEFDGLTAPNAYGDVPLFANDPARPNELYFQLVDWVVEAAARHSLYLGLLPTWGDKVARDMWGAGPAIFNPENARMYGRWLGQRYRDKPNILWILGGDRPAEHGGIDDRPTYRAMATGIDEGSQGQAFMTYHPMGGYSSSAWLHKEDWLDVNMMQSGHGSGRDTPTWEMIAADYARTPAKPVLDGEPNYEDHPVSPWPTWDPANGYYRDYDVRKQAYRSVLAGGCGVTYGHHSVWQFLKPGGMPINHADRDYLEALDRPGASQMQHLRQLIESRSFFSRMPDQTLVASDIGEKGDRIQAARIEGGGLVYLPTSHPVDILTGKIGRGRIYASWFDPRTGESTPAGEYTARGIQRFIPPGEGPDWLLVLEER